MTNTVDKCLSVLDKAIDFFGKRSTKEDVEANVLMVTECEYTISFRESWNKVVPKENSFDIPVGNSVEAAATLILDIHRWAAVNFPEATIEVVPIGTKLISQNPKVFTPPNCSNINCVRVSSDDANCAVMAKMVFS